MGKIRPSRFGLIAGHQALAPAYQAASGLHPSVSIPTLVQPAQLQEAGFKEQHTVSTDLLSSSTKRKLHQLADIPNIADINDVSLRLLLSGSSMGQLQLCTEAGAGANPGTYSNRFTCAVGKGKPVALYTGQLLEQHKQEALLSKARGEAPDSLSYLWSFELHTEMVKQHGYRGEPLVLSAESRGNGTRNCQDAEWLYGDESRNNLEARLLLVRNSTSSSSNSSNGEGGSDDPGMPVPCVVFYTTRAVQAGEEAFLGWGTDCKRACMQITVVHQGASQHKQHLYIKRLQQLARDMHIPEAAINQTQTAAVSGFGARLGSTSEAAAAAVGGGTTVKRNRKRLRLNAQMQTLEIFTVDLTASQPAPQQQQQRQGLPPARPTSSELSTLASPEVRRRDPRRRQQQQQQQQKQRQLGPAASAVAESNTVVATVLQQSRQAKKVTTAAPSTVPAAAAAAAPPPPAARELVLKRRKLAATAGAQLASNTAALAAAAAGTESAAVTAALLAAAGTLSQQAAGKPQSLKGFETSMDEHPDAENTAGPVSPASAAAAAATGPEAAAAAAAAADAVEAGAGAGLQQGALPPNTQALVIKTTVLLAQERQQQQQQDQQQQQQEGLKQQKQEQKQPEQQAIFIKREPGAEDEPERNVVWDSPPPHTSAAATAAAAAGAGAGVEFKTPVAPVKQSTSMAAGQPGEAAEAEMLAKQQQQKQQKSAVGPAHIPQLSAAALAAAAPAAAGGSGTASEGSDSEIECVDPVLDLKYEQLEYTDESHMLQLEHMDRVAASNTLGGRVSIKGMREASNTNPLRTVHEQCGVAANSCGAATAAAAAAAGPSKPAGTSGGAFRVVEDEQAVLAAAGVELLLHSAYSGAPEELLELMDELSVGDIPADRLCSDAAEALVLSGDLPKAAVAEVTDIMHPARWCAPPDSKQYALVAKQTISKDEPIGVYTGAVTQDGANSSTDSSLYVYAITKDDLGRICPSLRPHLRNRRGYQPLLDDDLCVDSRSRGNKARFINCAWGRAYKEYPGEAANVTAHCQWSRHLKRPVVVLYAKKTSPQELVGWYGWHFWDSTARHLAIEQAAYATRADRQIRAWKQLLAEHGMPQAQLCALEKECMQQDVESLSVFEA